MCVSAGATAESGGFAVENQGRGAGVDVHGDDGCGGSEWEAAEVLRIAERRMHVRSRGLVGGMGLGGRRDTAIDDGGGGIHEESRVASRPGIAFGNYDPVG